MRIRIYYEDTDAGGIVYHSNYIKFCERARSEIVFKAGIKFSKDRHFVVTKLLANYVKPAVLGDILEVKTSLESIGKASLSLNQNIYRVESINQKLQDPELLFTAKITVGFMLYGKLGRLEPELVSLFSSTL
ncbi:YbgC/FadM family acyl-CoA thioesterase [Campylobacter fetus]|uniref:Thioesterase n=1 Tax=Campylobacter fetus subsp. testudinum TaxID=1507806 RepID=A0AAX0HAN2_CAMFE|nr:YbgC/FadM family acyl-CoA thioesterase [Campylobacter fetus]AJB45180.1 thioesterase [Campylobacter fetus subsp. testudinum]AVK80853.1 thioesterase [Campylobacter fetus subsp. testudinum]EAI4322501.1 YbgC/FadM family acyl-CoA thioesterase [Campylobacter fetus]EAI4391911.1 YbgC/FadM family acyl-CoA thioesterase [Campylobacter fetus]EAK0827274.1 YbgC/FadM family acyl-CoA thioesterase [Campylobacter fetus]